MQFKSKCVSTCGKVVVCVRLSLAKIQCTVVFGFSYHPHFLWSRPLAGQSMYLILILGTMTC